jgi:hypothetical protein
MSLHGIGASMMAGRCARIRRKATIAQCEALFSLEVPT